MSEKFHVHNLGLKMSVVDKITLFLAEFIGTGLLVFLGCMGCVSGMGHEPTSHLLTAFAFGLVVMTVIQIFGCVSGGHFNPAVTVGAVIYKHVDIPTACIYVVGQMLGGIVGYATLAMVTPYKLRETPPGLCVTVPHSTITIGQAIAVEFLATGVLLLVCCAVWDPRNTKNTDSIPLRFGLVVGALAMVAGPYTGCSMNPARSFGPALYNNNFENHYVYWVGPLLAGLIFPIIFRAVFWREAPQERKPLREEFPLAQDKNSV